MCRFTILFLFLSFLCGTCCAQKSNFSALVQEGDIVFQHLDGGELGRAIDKVTKGFRKHDYNHCGMVVRVGDSLKVIEAIGRDVHLSALADFEKRCSPSDLLIGRLLPGYCNLIVGAERAALSLQGVPYDDYFEMNNGRLYCSELVYEAFRQANRGKPLFKLKPMTFKDPETNLLFPSWVAYYAKLKHPVPQHKPGINPGLLSRSSKLTIIPVVPFSNH
jgi:hypothetical protein